MLFLSRPGLGLVPDIVSYGAAISACEASSSWHSALALHMRMLMQRLQVSTIAQGALMNSVSSESKWQLTLLCLAELDHQKMAHNGAFSACERVSCWHQALQLLQGLSLRHLQVEASSFNSVVSSCGKASGKWETALEVLRSMPLYMAKPDLLTYDTAMMTCIRCGETQAALDTLSEHEGLRSPLSYLWSLSVMCASDPAVVERACVNAGDVASWQEAADSALFLYSTALLGAHSQIHTAAARHALERIRSLSLDMLVMCCWGAIGLHGSENLMAASVARAQHMLAFVGRTTSLHTYDFEKSGIKLLGVVFACRLSRCLPARFYASVRGLLLRVGQDLDAKASASESMQLIPPRAEKAMPRAARPSVLVDLPDRAAMYKPRAWEVYGGHSRLQLVAFAQDRFGDRQIFRDASHHHGFLHRLDVPSSGLVVVSKTFEAFYDLQLQLHAGRVCRDYEVLCHGWLPPRAEFTARIFWHGDGPSISGGRGRPSSTLMLLCRHCLHCLGALSSVSLRLRTGRKHQIRSHLAHVGSPVVGDEVYQTAATYRADSEHYTGNWLHRNKISFQSSSGKHCEVQCLRPPALSALLSQVRCLRSWTQTCKSSSRACATG